MNRSRISELLDKLSKFRSTDEVHNPYEDPALRRNVEEYLEALCAFGSCEYLLVGEAPGHRGCAVTGIPFTSEEVIMSGESAFLQKLRPTLTLHGTTKENTASEVWRFIARALQVPALWNVFPFHPHKEGQPASNRKPNAGEVAAGLKFVERIKEILNPKQIIAIGRVPEKALTKKYGNVPYIRHPSRNGGALFRKGLAPFLGI